MSGPSIHSSSKRSAPNIIGRRDDQSNARYPGVGNLNSFPHWTVHAAIILAIVTPIPVVILLRQVTIYGVWPDAPISVYFYFLAWYSFCIGGYLLGYSRARSRSLPCFDANFWVAVLALSGALGAVVLIYHFAVVRGYGFELAAYEVRVRQVMDAQSGYAGSWLGAFGRVLVAGIAAAWIIATQRWNHLRSSTLLILSASTFVFLYYQTHFEGGRILPVGLALAGIFGSTLSMISSISIEERVILQRIRIKHFIPIAYLFLILAASSLYSVDIFADRGAYQAEVAEETGPPTASSGAAGKVAAELKVLDQSLSDREEVSQYAKAYLGYTSVMDIDASVLRDPANFGEKDYVRAMALIYVTQGIGELARLWRVETLQHSWGRYQFPQIALLLGILSGQDFRYEIPSGVPDGTYVTVPGAFYLDFGVILGLCLAGAIGIVLRRGVDSALSGSFSLAAFMAPIFFLVPLGGPVTSVVPAFWPALTWIFVAYIACLAKR